MKLPKINWVPFDRNNPPIDLCDVETYLIFFREDDYDDGATWTYHVDYATAYGSYLDNFWDTENDWDEGQRIEVLAYAEFPNFFKGMRFDGGSIMADVSQTPCIDCVHCEVRGHMSKVVAAREALDEVNVHINTDRFMRLRDMNWLSTKLECRYFKKEGRFIDDL